MSPRKARLLQDKALRDAARLNVTTDVELIKADMQEQGPGNRLAEAGTDYLQILCDGALDIFQENKGKMAGGVALGIAGIAAWIFRDTILEVIDGMLDAIDTADPEHTGSQSIAATDKNLSEQSEQ